MWRKTRIAAVALTLVMALAPAAPRAQDAEGEASTARKAIAYAGCIGSVVLLPLTVAGVFAMAIACANALAVGAEVD
jgi:hypothetical protein